MSGDLELYLDIDDDFKHMELFDTGSSYPEPDDYTNAVRASVWSGDKIIAYLECVLFYDMRIAESRYDHVYIADGLTQDTYDAMTLLDEFSLLTVTDENQSLGELLATDPTVTVYLHHVAVREDFRRNGIGNWLFKNLPMILQRNYRVFPRLIITLLTPQTINWNIQRPSFSDLNETVADGEMVRVMTRVLEKNGYKRLNDTWYYVARP